MCFSATASFTSAALLITVGTATSLINPSKSQKMYAAIPILFGVQQAAEGLVWLSIGQEYSMTLQRVGVIGFLGFAMVVWPCWVPWSLFRMETLVLRKRILMLMGFIGVCVSAMTAWYLFISTPSAYITGQCLAYSLKDLTRNVPPNIDFLLYVTTVPLPFFVSSLRHVNITGALVLVGLVLSHIINREASTSIWCFFAAIASLNIAWSLLNERRLYEINRADKVVISE
jgi:hypothetical protein